jgi:hypothetical protein
VSKGTIPADLDKAKLEELMAQHNGKIPPEVLQQMGMGAPKQSQVVSRPKKDRKKQKAKRKQGRKRN